MTKLFTRAFASLPEDVKRDEQLSEKMALVQQFIRPEYLDIKPSLQNETSWLVSNGIIYIAKLSLCCNCHGLPNEMPWLVSNGIIFIANLALCCIFLGFFHNKMPDQYMFSICK